MQEQVQNLLSGENVKPIDHGKFDLELKGLYRSKPLLLEIQNLQEKVLLRLEEPVLDAQQNC
jgi:hypothetical protein